MKLTSASPRRSNTWWVALGIVLTASVVVAGYEFGHQDPSDPRSGGGSNESVSVGGAEHITIGPPAAWTVDLAQAEAALVFKPRLPDTAAINSATLTKVAMDPIGNALFLEYPSLASDTQTTRQSHIEVYEAVWYGGDPLTAYQEDMAKSPAVGKTVCAVGSLPAVCVLPNSPSDTDQSNAAYLEFVDAGVEYEISGGGELAALLAIARSILQG